MDVDALLVDLLRGFQGEAQDLCERITKSLLKVEGAEPGSDALKACYDDLARALHNLKGSAATIGLPDLADIAHALEDRLAPLKREVRPMPGKMVDEFLLELDRLMQTLRARVESGAAAPLPQVLDEETAPPALVESQPEAPEESWRIDGEQIGALLAHIERLREVRLRLEERHRELARGTAQLVRRERADTGELRDALLGTGHALQSDTAELADVIEGLEQGANALCTLPVETLLGPLRRTVRDLARQLGKEAKLSAVGAESALARRVLEALRGPLVQLVRNALDHGLEPPAARERAGKHRVGALVMRVEHVGNMVFLELSDDGAGIDHERIRSLAVERGLLPAERAATATPAELTRLIFRSGFSTRDTVSETSGRGVGLDVVHAELTRLQGQIEVQSTPGQGTRFTLSVPADLGSSPLLLVRVGEHVVGLPMHGVRGCVATRAENLRPGGRAGPQLVHAEQLLDVIDLGARLGLRRPMTPAAEQPLVLMVPEDRLVALAVDEVLGERDLVVRPMPEELRGLEAYQGLAVLARGEPALIVRPGWLLKNEHSEKASAPNVVLVVDDSLTTRAIHRSVLESGGYTVHTAGNAAQALEQLGRSQYAALVCDISLGEGLDGFGLTAALRAQPATRRVPVVLVSAHDTSENRQRGVEAGADGFLSKRDCAAGRLLAEVMQAIARRGGTA